MGLAVLGYRNYIARPKYEIVSSGLKTGKVDYESAVKKQNIVNINTADINKIESLPGIGPKLAKDIIDYRSVHGPFILKEDLMKVGGIGQKKFDGMRDLISLE